MMMLRSQLKAAAWGQHGGTCREPCCSATAQDAVGDRSGQDPHQLQGSTASTSLAVVALTLRYGGMLDSFPLPSEP